MIFGDGNGGTQGTGITICLLNNNYLGMVARCRNCFMESVTVRPVCAGRPSCPGGCKGPNDQWSGICSGFRETGRKLWMHTESV